MTIDELKKLYKEYIPLKKTLKAKEKYIYELKQQLILIPSKYHDEFYYKSKNHFLQLFAEYEKDYKNTADKLAKLVYYNSLAKGIGGELLHLRLFSDKNMRNCWLCRKASTALYKTRSTKYM